MIPLGKEWREHLDQIAAQVGALRSTDAGLAQGVREVSDAYNAGNFRFSWTPARMGARIHFFLPRDQAKIAASIRDVPIPSARAGSVRVLDVGCGIGASALGFVRGLRMRGNQSKINLDLFDTDAVAAGIAARVLQGVENLNATVVAASGEGKYDAILLGQVLVEMGAAGANSLTALASKQLAPGGMIVIVEPALRDVTRRLHVIRDEIVRAGSLHVVAPCTHDQPCAMLANPRDWCHDDLPVNLPDWLRPVARSAGLRWEGLTYTRLILSNQPVRRPPLRVVAPPRDTKGRTERQLCGIHPDDTALKWVDRLDKHATPGNGAWSALQRGDALTISPPSSRVHADTRVELWPTDPPSKPPTD